MNQTKPHHTITAFFCLFAEIESAWISINGWPSFLASKLTYMSAFCKSWSQTKLMSKVIGNLGVQMQFTKLNTLDLDFKDLKGSVIKVY